MKKPVPPVKFFPLLLLIALLLITSPLVFAHTGDGCHRLMGLTSAWQRNAIQYIAASYAAGFMLATMLLHLCGIGLALLCKKFTGTRWIRFSGIIIAGYGGFLLIP
ncbi:HupE/UreJ family protein [Nitrosomonas oligotropha]|uniref:HupE / UreJ protein n=1 Tax=Nitrosomonas oligotropha TaxID=42354 RepID=A0A1H8MIN9_9PROT|nr:HupE/UreJ family protein [Nitrosomonas oligotropha]SDW45949.1 HupE / UreJ protein [Nitrosomonas oligotropha]SEO17078.1 HupE / UreJ protein [Nitrosomonas oligotropha]